MIVSVIYPNHDNARFDGDYYRDHHAPLVRDIWQPEGITLVKGAAAADGSAAPFALIAHFHFATAEAMQAALANPRSAEARADIANFTDIQPIVMVGAEL